MTMLYLRLAFETPEGAITVKDRIIVWAIRFTAALLIGLTLSLADIGG